MKRVLFSLLFVSFVSAAICKSSTVGHYQKEINSDFENPPYITPYANTYLEEIKQLLSVQWPANRTINIVFHGHSVPAGYFVTPDVRTLESYPHIVLENIKSKYPYATINSIVTAIGGETSRQGAARFEQEVLNHKPDVLVIDYALNDRSDGLEAALIAWELMIERALAANIKVILCTPTPDLSTDILDDFSPLAQHAGQIRRLSSKYEIGLADFYAVFKDIAENNEDLEKYMSQVNHPNLEGHKIAAEQIIKWF